MDNGLAGVICVLLLPFSARAENAYTNHAGNAVSGRPVALTRTQVVLVEDAAANAGQAATNDVPLSASQPFNLSAFRPSGLSTTNAYPLSIFPESEQRRIAADFGEPRVPAPVKRAVEGARRAMARSRRRAELGLCTQEESDDFCAKSEAALEGYLDKQVAEGAITPAERAALVR